MEDLALLITGTAPFSLGEAFVKEQARHSPSTNIISIDIIRNPELKRFPHYREIIFDLNPLLHSENYEQFSIQLESEISRVIKELRCTGIYCFIQAAGIYESGEFVSHKALARKRILGVNTIAMVELLHLVLSLNASFGIKNGEILTYVDIGAAHGLSASAGRSLYASCKAFGIDLCTALQAGSEVHRCIHFAPGPIDTHMLHRNQWVTRASGPPEFFDQIYIDSRNRYKSIFVECDAASFFTEALRFAPDNSQLLQAFDKYCLEREKAFHKEEGVLDASYCAKALVQIIAQPDRCGPGIYFAKSSGSKSIDLTVLPFPELVRRTLFESKAQVCDIAVTD